ncbi:class I SAM-dependent methyltransferase [Actinoplanes sp. NPDC089786]|uniref:class I SAM-dependent methyltransferase n=1 Tax=Actinoplanes sp. NPDC089786 TaxID=3155185 RepID=UPI0034160D3A
MQQTWRLFDRLASSYDEVVPFFASFGRSIVSALDPPPGCRFLDLGAGRGALTDPALARGCRVTAVDAAPGMTERLAAAYPSATVLTFSLGFSDELPLPAASFDLVAAAFVVHVLDDPAAAVASAHRVLAPGGRFAMTGGGHPSSGFVSGLDDLFATFTPHLPPGGSMGALRPPAALLAGFDDVHEVIVTSEVHIPDNDVLWRWVMSRGYRAFVEDLPPGPRASFEDHVRELPLGDGMLRRSSSLWIGTKPSG